MNNGFHNAGCNDTLKVSENYAIQRRPVGTSLRLSAQRFLWNKAYLFESHVNGILGRNGNAVYTGAVSWVDSSWIIFEKSRETGVVLAKQAVNGTGHRCSM